MSLLGLNITISITRRTSSKNSGGGAVITESTVATAVKARLGNASRSQEMRLQEWGYETKRAHQIVAQPSDLNVQENDYITASGGQYDGQKFIVLSVRKDNLPASDSRSHVELLCERVIEARTVP